jgi:probable phosphoglycerate mutase
VDKQAGRLIVLRHGETDYNRQGRYQGSTDIELNDSGKEQAKIAAGNLTGLEIDHIVSSPLKRAFETAESISTALHIPVEVNADFVERNMGLYEGLTREEIGQQYPELNGWMITRQFYASPPQGESLFDFSLRLYNGLSTLREAYTGRKVLLVCHGGVARSINGIMRRATDDQVFSYKLANCDTDSYDW